jgi:hypothetical protein
VFRVKWLDVVGPHGEGQLGLGKNPMSHWHMEYPGRVEGGSGPPTLEEFGKGKKLHKV